MRNISDKSCTEN